MFTWSNMHVMNEYVDNVCILEDEKKSPKENVPPQLPLLNPKIYPIIFPGLIRYANTSHFSIVFFLCSSCVIISILKHYPSQH